MRSTLKKSLYLGLAALSFASVAGAANNADAAKKTKPAKTYATASYQPIANQGQSNSAYTVTGSNALFDKPGTVKGAKQSVSKATMGDLASSKQNFMVYQTATTNRGSKYIKVVSFDKQYRGWIYAGNTTTPGFGSGVQTVNLSTPATPQSNQVYLKTPGQTPLKTAPDNAQFDTPTNSFAQTGFVANDAFKVDSAQTVSKTGTTWYHVTDQKDNTINGWVPSDQVQLGSNNNYFDKNNDIQVNYTSNGQTIKTGIVKVSDLNKRYSNSGVLSPATNGTSLGLADRINQTAGNTLNGSGYSFTNFTGNVDTNTSGNNNINAIQYVQAGDTINLDINGSGQGDVASHMSFNVLGSNFTAPSKLDKSSFNVPALSTDQLSKQLNGYNSRQQIDMHNVLGITNTSYNDHINDNDNNNIFGVSTNISNPNKLGVLYGGTQYATSTINNGAASDNDVQNAQKTTTDQSNNNAPNLTRSTTINQGQPYHYAYMLDIPTTRDNNQGNYGQNIQLYYRAVPVSGSTSFSSANNSTQNYFNQNQ